MNVQRVPGLEWLDRRRISVLKVLFKLTSLVAGGICGYFVWNSVVEFFPPYIAYSAGGLVAIVVFATLYFLLGRPLADFLHHRAEIISSRLRDNRSGTDIDIVPVAYYGKKHELVKCSICGRPGEPVCQECKAKLAGD